MTLKKCITDTLEDLSEPDFRKFCYQLRDRPGSPRIRRRDVDNKSTWEITELLVSTFTEPKALQVAVHTLRQMNRNQEAKTLEEKTKAFFNLSRSGQKGQVLVGIGPYGWMTLEDLYESNDSQKISYVDSLRERMLIHEGSRTEFAVEYILQRDKEKAAAKRRINSST